MKNSIFDALNGRNQNGGILGNFNQSFLSFVEQFKKENSCTPEQKVQQLLNSGQMSQEQFNQLRQMANQITGKKL